MMSYYGYRENKSAAIVGGFLSILCLLSFFYSSVNVQETELVEPTSGSPPQPVKRWEFNPIKCMQEVFGKLSVAACAWNNSCNLDACKRDVACPSCNNYPKCSNGDMLR